MKKLLLLAVALTAMLSTNAQTVKFSSNTPVPGQPLSFEYDPGSGTLNKLVDIKCQVYVYTGSDASPKRFNIPLIKEQNIYKGTLKAIDSAQIAILVFNAGETRDENPNGYYTLFYEKGKPTPMAYFYEASFYNGTGKALAGVKPNPDKALIAYDKAFEADPNLKGKYIVGYLALNYNIDKEKGRKMIDDQISALNKIQSTKEDDLSKVANLYSILAKKTATDSVLNLIKTKYPKGNYAYNLAAGNVYREKDPVKMEEKLNSLIAEFNLDAKKEADAMKINSFYPTLATIYGAKNNAEKFEFYCEKVSSKTTRAGLYNSYAWARAEAKNDLEFASKVSKKSIDLIELAKNDNMPSYFVSKEDYIKSLNGSYASYADTYAVLLDLMGKKADALSFQEEAVNKNNFSSIDMNTRYITLLAKNDKKDKVVTYAEKFIKDGKGTEQMKIELKSAYNGTIPFDTYYAALEKESAVKERAKFMKEMINRPAPKFTLVNLKGETVSLDQLKGKVVIVDYWATWCGPCVASFPGMQKAVDKYKSDPNVVFLFVNTWQTEENREKVVKDYIATTPYTFNVLLDTKNKKDPNKFDVIDSYNLDGDGIPQKYIIGPDGNIRFKKVGFGGTAEGTVKELDIMIELAKGTKEASK